jgi:hypothetical protein
MISINERLSRWYGSLEPWVLVDGPKIVTVFVTAYLLNKLAKKLVKRIMRIIIKKQADRYAF